jgi:predicted translin family RNA/ssDNA-binding protein
LKNRPTSNNLDQVKDELKAAQDNLNKWTGKFPGKNPDQVDNESKKAVADLQKELDGWENEFTDKDPKTVAQELTEANQNKNKLNDWQVKFPDKSAEQVKKELDDLKDKSTGTTLTPKQQELLNCITLDHYKTISNFMERQGLGVNWRDEILGENWKAEVQQANK